MNANADSLRSATCPSCASTDLAAFYSVAATPVTCTSVFDSRDEARAVPSGRVDLVYCRGCSLIFNPRFDPVLADVGARYESSQAASGHFSEFTRSLSRRWVERYSLVGKTVLEVGCGHGEFLERMLADGVARGVGLDPVSTGVTASAGPLQILARRFDASTVDIEADALVCRHTLEHIPDLREFLGHLASWARRRQNRVVLFEVPATERILTERAFWDVYFEHCNYFTADSLSCAFGIAGFNVRVMDRVYSDQYLILEATIDTGGGTTPLRAPPDNLAECRHFGNESRLAIERCDQGLIDIETKGRSIVLWQGAAKTVGFLATLGQSGLIQCAVDMSPARHGKFLPGTGLPVHAPEALRQIEAPYVVLMNPVYRKEVAEKLAGMGVNANLLTVNELCASEPA